MTYGLLISCVLFAFSATCATSFPFIDELYEGSQCLLENGAIGICKMLPACPIILKDVQEGRRNGASGGRCGFDGVVEIVCCPMNFADKIGHRPADEACHQYDNEVGTDSRDVRFLILQGEEARPKEFPYMAALGYKDEDANAIRYTCGGALISEWHVLTAAHCVRNIDNRIPVEVRLGSVDLTDNGPEVQRISVRDHIPHPQYKSSLNYHDVAILKLETKVRMSSFVKPICLQSKSPTSLITSSVNVSLTVIGFGYTENLGETSQKLMKAEGLRFVEKDTCAKPYRSFTRKLPGGLDDTLICAIDSNTTRKADACQGDSGGPLLMDSDSGPVVVGVTAFGQVCGTVVPGVYTSVFAYLEWIETQVWPTS